MHYANLLPTLLALALAAPGCGAKSSVEDDTGSAGTDPGASTTTAPTTTGTTTGDPTTSAATGSGTTLGGEDSSSSSGSVSGTTTGGLDCSLLAQACAAAEEGGQVDDCGVVTPDDPAPLWQAAHDCALAAVAEQRSFKLITVLQGIDSDIGRAYVGVAGDEYLTEVFYFDSDPCGGGGCGPAISRGICGASLIASPDCTIEPTTICLTCDAEGDNLEVCG